MASIIKGIFGFGNEPPPPPPPNREQQGYYNKFMKDFAGHPYNYGDTNLKGEINKLISGIVLSSLNTDGTLNKASFSDKIISINSKGQDINDKDVKWVMLKTLKLAGCIDSLKESFKNSNKNNFDPTVLKITSDLLDFAKEIDQRSKLMQHIKASFMLFPPDTLTQQSVIKLVEFIFDKPDQELADIKVLNTLKDKSNGVTEREIAWHIYQHRLDTKEVQSFVDKFQSSGKPLNQSFVKFVLDTLEIKNINLQSEQTIDHYAKEQYDDPEYIQWLKSLMEPPSLPASQDLSKSVSNDLKVPKDNLQNEKPFISQDLELTADNSQNAAFMTDEPITTKNFGETNKPEHDILEKTLPNHAAPVEEIAPPVEEVPIKVEDLNFSKILDMLYQNFDEQEKLKPELNGQEINKQITEIINHLLRMKGQSERLNLIFPVKLSLEKILNKLNAILNVGDPVFKTSKDLLEKTNLNGLKEEYPLYSS